MADNETTGLDHKDIVQQVIAGLAVIAIAEYFYLKFRKRGKR